MKGEEWEKRNSRRSFRLATDMWQFGTAWQVDFSVSKKAGAAQLPRQICRNKGFAVHRALTTAAIAAAPARPVTRALASVCFAVLQRSSTYYTSARRFDKMALLSAEIHRWRVAAGSMQASQSCIFIVQQREITLTNVCSRKALVMSSKNVEDNSARHAQVPANFPRPVHMGAVPGAQPKLLMVKYEGRYYSPGCTPPELWERWDTCEHLAQQFCRKSLDSKLGKRASMSEAEILDQYLERLLKTGWGSDSEMRWVIRRAAELAHWPAPESSIEGNQFQAPG